MSSDRRASRSRGRRRPRPERRPPRPADHGDHAARIDRRLALLSEMVHSAGVLLDPGMVSRFIMERAAALVGSPRWRLYRLDEAAGMLRLDARDPSAESALAAAELPLDCGLAGCAARLRVVVCASAGDAEAQPDTLREWPQPAPPDVLAVPLISRGRVIGVAELAAPAAGRFTEEDSRLIATLMEPAAIALDNALLFRKLEERTITDDLTGLYNARFMENFLKREAKRAGRKGGPVALLFLDLDGFKQVNDNFGHLAGSRTLVEVGELLRTSARETDVVARWGGDEFAIVLSDTGVPGAEVVAERIRRRIEDQHFLRTFGLDVRISVSIGIAAWPEHGRTAEALLAAADAAMYEVKYAGKNAVRVAAGAPVG